VCWSLPFHWQHISGHSVWLAYMICQHLLLTKCTYRSWDEVVEMEISYQHMLWHQWLLWLLQPANIHQPVVQARRWPCRSRVMDTDCIWSYFFSCWRLEFQVSRPVVSTDETSAGWLPLHIIYYIQLIHWNICIYLGFWLLFTGFHSSDDVLHLSSYFSRVTQSHISNNITT